MPRSLRSRSHLSPANKDMQAACGSKRVAASREIGLQTPADADQFPNEHAADRDGKDCNREDEAPETADGGELVSRPKTRARKLKEPPSQQKSDHQQRKRQKIANSISAPSRKPLTWEDSFKLLEQYEKDSSHTRVPQNYVDASTGSNLGIWVNTQRKFYARGRLSEERIRRLNSIDFEWKARKQSAPESWDIWFERLEKYKKDHQHTRVPQQYVDKSGSKLGRWVDTQRQQRYQLSEERRQRLDSIGFKWKARETYKSKSWDTWFQLLVTFKEEHEHACVPQNYVDASGSKLGIWVNTQRKSDAKKKLSEERKQRLNSIGFEWKGREQIQSETWDTWFQLLVEYKEEHHHTCVPQTYVDAMGFKLGIWVNTQRKSYASDELSPEREQRLESIGFEWSASHRGDLKKRISLYSGIRTLREVDPSELAVVLTEGRPWRCVSGEDESGAVGVVDGTVVSVPFDDDFVWF